MIHVLRGGSLVGAYRIGQCKKGVGVHEVLLILAGSVCMKGVVVDGGYQTPACVPLCSACMPC